MNETTDPDAPAQEEVSLAWGVTQTTDEVEEALRGFYICGFNAADVEAVEAAADSDTPPPQPLVLLHLAHVEGATVAEAGATASAMADVFNNAFPTITLRAAEGSTTEEEPRG